MKAWKITRVPIVAGTTDEHIDICSMKTILYNVHSSSDSSSSIELVFLHENESEISIYLFSHAVDASGIDHVITQQLAAAGYQFEVVDTLACKRVYNLLRQSSLQGSYAIAKNEKLVTTAYVPEGYYYWTEPLLREEDKQMSNFTSIFHALLNNVGAFVSIQLIPTRPTAYEVNSLQFLSGFLSNRVKSPAPGFGGMSVYEPYALPAFQAYSHIVSNLNQPFFMYNIIAYAPNMQSESLAKQTSSWIQSETDTNAEVHVFPLNQFRYCGSEDQFPIELNNFITHNCRDRYIWGGRIPAPKALFRLPFLVSEKEAELFFNLPVDDGAIRGVVGTNYRASNERLSTDVTCYDNIAFGTAVTAQNEQIGASEDAFSKHALIVGMPGTGKTTFSMNMLLQFAERKIPFLAIEPTKAEYRAMIDAIPDLQIFTPGNSEVSPFVWNPFIPPKGISVENYIPSLFSGFRAAFSMNPPLDAAFLQAIRTAYIRYGWRDYSKAGDPNVTPFGMHEFIIVFKDLIDKSNYSKDIKGNLQSGGVLRLSNLIQQNRYIFDTVNSVPVEDLLSRPTVIELNSIDNAEHKSLIIALLLISIGAFTKNRQEECTGLENIILLDEAHVLLGQRQQPSYNGTPDAQSFAVQLVENLIAEIRAYGTGVIIADQRPSAVGEAIVANTDIKIAFRLTEKREKEIIANSADFDDSMQMQISRLEKGQAFVYYNKLLKPQMIQTSDIRQNRNIRIRVSDDEIRRRCKALEGKEKLLRPHLMCKYCACEDLKCAYRIRADAEYYASRLWDEIYAKVLDAEFLLRYCNEIPIVFENEFGKYSKSERNSLIICTRIALIRKAEFEKNLFLTERQKDFVLSSSKVRSNDNG